MDFKMVVLILTQINFYVIIHYYIKIINVFKDVLTQLFQIMIYFALI